MTISFSLIAVFIPLLMMGGIVGRLFREFAVTLSVAILVSLAVSLATTPMMCALLLKREAHGRRNYFHRATEWGFDAMLRGYERTLSWALNHPRLIMLVLAPALFALASRRERLTRRRPVEQIQLAALEPGRPENFLGLDQANVPAVEDGVAAHIRAI